MIELTCDTKSAMVVLHEIYGINRHIQGVCEQYHASGYDVFCPNLLDRPEPFRYDEQEQAYQYYRDRGTAESRAQIGDFICGIRPRYESLYVIGFSVGATLAWTLSENRCCDRMVCYYGSRVRDHLQIQPKCPVLMIFAEQEASFCPADLLDELSAKPGVAALVLEGRHGFMDPYSVNHHPKSADEAYKLTQRFLAR